MKIFQTRDLLKELEKEKEIEKKLLEEREKIKLEISKILKKDLEKKRGEISKKIEEIKNEIKNIEGKEEKVKLEKKDIEEKEEREKNLRKKREIERERWEVEKKERNLERKKWKLEDKLEEKERELIKIQKELEESDNLKKSLKEIEKSLKEKKSKITELEEKIKEQEKLEKSFQEAWKNFISGDIKSALEKLKEIQKELSKKIEKVSEKEEEKEEKEKEFFKPLEYYTRGEIPQALTSLEDLLKKIEKKPLIEKKEEIKKPLVVIEEKKVPKEEIMEEFKKKLKEEREKIIEEEKEKLKKLRKEFEEKQKKILETTIKGEKLGEEEEKLLEIQKELLRKELEIEREVQERLKTEKEKLLKKREELAEAEKSLSLEELTEEERKRREEIIRSLREKIEQEREKIENKELLEIKEREISRQRKLKILEEVFEQALSFYNEREYEKAKRIFSIIKDQLEEGKKLGIFVNLNNIPIYTKTIYFTNKIEEETKKAKLEIKPKELKKTKPKIEIVSKKIKISSLLRKYLQSFKESFLHLPKVGLDISDFSLELIYLTKRKKILAFSRETLKPGILVNGKVEEPKLFSQVLKELLQKAGFPPFQPRKGPVLKAVISLPNSIVYPLIFDSENYNTLLKEVKEKLEENIPFSLEEIYWDYISYKKENSKKIKVFCVAVEKEIVDTLVYFLRANGIDPIALDVGMLSIARVFLPLFPKMEIGILDIGAHTTNFNIFDKNGVIEFSTVIPYGSFNFQQKASLKEEIKKIAEEIKNLIDYYQEISDSKIEKLILTGGGSLLPETVETFQANFPEIKIEIENPFTKIKGGKNLRDEKSILFVGALGLALRAISKNPVKEGINLLPEELKKKERKTHFF